MKYTILTMFLGISVAAAPNQHVLNVNDLNSTVRLAQDEILVVQLPTRLSTGFTWDVETTEALPLIKRDQVSNDSDLERLYFKSVAAGEITLTFTHHQPWDPTTETKQSVNVITDGAYTGTFDPPQEITQELGLSGDTTKYNVCSDGVNQYGRCTPVKNQGSCGSCWAFATTGVVENILHFTHPNNGTYDLSEQYMLSCNPWGWNCEMGGLPSFQMFVGEGAVYERDVPYVGKKIPVACESKPKHEHIAGWHALNRNPSVDDIKKAIVRYGPVFATVCADNDFAYYKSGIFRGHCDNVTGLTNHAIILVGWNDDGGYWILRNSWSSYWGDHGYMRIAYGANFVGDKVFVAESLDPVPPPPGSDVRDTGCSSTTGSTWLALVGILLMCKPRFDRTLLRAVNKDI